MDSKEHAAEERGTGEGVRRVSAEQTAAEDQARPEAGAKTSSEAEGRSQAEKNAMERSEAEGRPQSWADAAARAAALRAERSKDLRAAKARLQKQPVRAINEDDDGYDPYSDLHDKRVNEPLFQRDPWQ